MNAIFSQLNKLSGQAHWLPRLALAGTFLYHGLPKLMDPGSMQGMPMAMAIIVGIVECGGGLLMLYGGFGPDWATRTAGLGFTAIMLGAIPMVHWQHGWNSIGAMGMEFQVLILATSFMYATKGNAINAATPVAATAAS